MSGRGFEAFTNPTVLYILADTGTRCFEAWASVQRERARVKADAIRRLIDLATGTVIGALGMGFAILAAGAWGV